ncbi:hypothetical protein [Methylophaga thiooxydans]|uniref:Uncharacterized protein n=1 Tax=Methylophaga thiooxydans DMS010 TaxID=637616 RepID=C0N8U3_9GAMM|nr:hypothetical protein [Methylophaga thiooxydans]EEF78775.1 hypothetical protein MDMS009_2519 [Methylophaga thiooxydans DMS010]
MNDVINAIGARFRSPYFGYAVLTFFALNWRGIFLLLTLESEPELRLSAFDAQTNFWTLVVLPLIFGVLVAASSQWIRYGFQLVSRKPLELLEILTLEAENTKLIKQNELEQKRAQYFSDREEELIGRAKRDEEVSQITDSQTKDKLSTQLEQLRKERDALSKQVQVSNMEPSLSEAAEMILKAAIDTNDGNIIKLSTFDGDFLEIGREYYGIEGTREFAKFEAALEELIQYGLVKNIGNNDTNFKLTHQGWLEGKGLRN